MTNTAMVLQRYFYNLQEIVKQTQRKYKEQLMLNFQILCEQFLSILEISLEDYE